MLCDEIQRQARRVWYLLRQARLASVLVGEQTITDLLVLDLRTRNSKEIRTVKFNARAEGKTGADWEWWFRGMSGAWLAFRVQAKIYDWRSGRYPHLHYRQSNGTYQCDRLVSSAYSHQSRPVPIYIFYNNWEAPSFLGVDWRCGTYPRSAPLLGLTLLRAEQVRLLRAHNETSVAAVFKYGYPAHCLFCCPAVGNGDLATRARKWATAVLHSYPPSIDLHRDIDRVEGSLQLASQIEAWEGPNITQDPPAYVQAAAAGAVLDDAPDPHLGYITIFDEQGLLRTT